MTEERPPLQKKMISPKKNEARLAKALRENLHRRKAQVRSRSNQDDTNQSESMKDQDLERKSDRDSGDG